MKPDSVECMKCMAYGVAIALLCLLLWAVTTSARAAEPSKAPKLPLILPPVRDGGNT